MILLIKRVDKGIQTQNKEERMKINMLLCNVYHRLIKPV